MLQSARDLVGKLAAGIDGLSAAACPGWIAALHHEVVDDSMEYGVVIVAASAELEKILHRPWRMTRVELDREGSHGRLDGDLRRC